MPSLPDFLLPPARALTGRRFVLPFYHAVSDAPMPHIAPLYPVPSVRRFTSDIDALLRHYTPVSLQEVVAHVHTGATLPRNAFFLSFDDGLRECAEVIAPILLAKGVPATFFLNSAFLDNRALMFRCKAALLAHHFPALRARALATPYAQAATLDALAGQHGLDFGAFLQAQRPYMSKEQVRHLVAAGFSIGSHSVDHPLYSALSPEEQGRQTAVCQAMIAPFLRPGDPRAFAFPFTDAGVGKDFFAPYNRPNPFGIDISFGTAGIKTHAAPRHLERLPLEKSTYPAEWQLVGAYLYYLIKAPFGRNKIAL